MENRSLLDRRARYAEQIAALLDQFIAQGVCGDCGRGLESHWISPDGLGNAHPWCVQPGKRLQLPGANVLRTAAGEVLNPAHVARVYLIQSPENRADPAAASLWRVRADLHPWTPERVCTFDLTAWCSEPEAALALAAAAVIIGRS